MSPSPEISQALNALRPKLLRFATLQLRDASAAEDAVQETLLAALQNQQTFRGEASLKTWLFSILRNKIVDIIRQRSRETTLDEPFVDDDQDDFSALFDEQGHWNREDRPSSWGNPQQTLENNHFWTIFDICLSNLPEKTSRVFMMREFLGFDTDEICKELKISSSNCWVILHRARMGLRLCLQDRWFGTIDTPSHSSVPTR